MIICTEMANIKFRTVVISKEGDKAMRSGRHTQRASTLSNTFYFLKH